MLSDLGTQDPNYQTLAGIGADVFGQDKAAGGGGEGGAGPKAPAGGGGMAGNIKKLTLKSSRTNLLFDVISSLVIFPKY